MSSSYTNAETDPILHICGVNASTNVASLFRKPEANFNTEPISPFSLTYRLRQLAKYAREAPGASTETLPAVAMRLCILAEILAEEWRGAVVRCGIEDREERGSEALRFVEAFAGVAKTIVLEDVERKVGQAWMLEKLERFLEDHLEEADVEVRQLDVSDDKGAKGRQSRPSPKDMLLETGISSDESNLPEAYKRGDLTKGDSLAGVCVAGDSSPLGRVDGEAAQATDASMAQRLADVKLNEASMSRLRRELVFELSNPKRCPIALRESPQIQVSITTAPVKSTRKKIQEVGAERTVVRIDPAKPARWSCTGIVCDTECGHLGLHGWRDC